MNRHQSPMLQSPMLQSPMNRQSARTLPQTCLMAIALGVLVVLTAGKEHARGQHAQAHPAHLQESRTQQAQQVQKQERPLPNILWIVSEDNSPLIGAYGDNFATTPNIDRLASEGFFYTHAYANAPVCAPARRSEERRVGKVCSRRME